MRCLFFPGIDYWDLQRGRAELCSTKATNRNGFISRSARGLQKGPGAAGGPGALHTAMVCAQRVLWPGLSMMGNAPNTQKPVLEGPRPPSTLRSETQAVLDLKHWGASGLTPSTL